MEAKTDLWVYDLLKNANISLDPQGSRIKELNDALKSASKKKTGKHGKPEYVGIVDDFIIVIEDKERLADHIKLDDHQRISFEVDSVKRFAVNGALHYGRHLIKNTSYKKCFAIAVSGGKSKHKITPFYINEYGSYKMLDEVESFVFFNNDNIQEYYTTVVLGEKTDKEKTTEEILKDASELHGELRKYGSLQTIEKPLVVAGILLALKEKEFEVDKLDVDPLNPAGTKIYAAIEKCLKRSNVSPEEKKDKILSQFSPLFKYNQKLNEVHPLLVDGSNSGDGVYLHKSPLRYFSEIIKEKLYDTIHHSKSTEDYIGRFYGEFMSYSGGDGQSLGIILTPRHITELFCELLKINHKDKVFDPTAGTGGFLIAAMHYMLKQSDTETERAAIKQNQLHGIELQSYMFTIASANMILRGDGKSNLKSDDFFRVDPSDLQLEQYTKGMMNPPYSQGTKTNPELYEISFVIRLLDSLVPGGRAAVIVPVSTMCGKTPEERQIKDELLMKHTLEGVITLNPNTFYGVATNTCIAVFTARVRHEREKKVKFINFVEDGFAVKPHVGLVETQVAKDKKQHLLDVWLEKDDISFTPSFCLLQEIETPGVEILKKEDEDEKEVYIISNSTDEEWLHSYYYFNDNIPSLSLFKKSAFDYLSFKIHMLLRGKKYLFKEDSLQKDINPPLRIDLRRKKRKWVGVKIEEIFDISSGERLTKAEMSKGRIPFIGATDKNNGITGWTNSKNNSLDKNVLGVNYNGSVCESFYHPYECLFSDDVKRFKLKDAGKNNKYVLLFLKTCILNQKCKFAYGYKFNTGRMQKTKILIPVTPSGEPDYDYMEKYMKAIFFISFKKLAAQDNV